jgi:ABC-type uncharacterized transport system substrate-binding protein
VLHTGVTTNNSKLSAKRLSLVKEAVPTASRVAVLENPDFKPSSSMLRQMEVTARPLGLQLQVVEAPRPVAPQPARTGVELVANSRIQAMYHLRQYLEVGGLMVRTALAI